MTHIGLCNDVLTHPVGYASYAVRVPQYRYLQSGLLQCMDHSKPPCHLLMFRVINPAHKRLSLFGFLFLRTIFTIQGTHRVDGPATCRQHGAPLTPLYVRASHTAVH